MKPTRIRIFAATALLFVAGAVLGNSGDDKTLQQIAGYRQWTRVNEKPIAVENSLIAGG